MKKSILILPLLLISLISVRGQTPMYSCIINFEDNPCWEGSYFEVTIQGSNNMWVIGRPDKTVFDSAWSAPDAILTDSAGPYPVNNTSGFIIEFIPLVYCMCAPIIGGWYKFDSDSLKDFGRIEFSLDHGTTWLNALSDTIIPDEFWTTPKPILTGRIHQWREFNAFIPDWWFTTDTLIYRFTFISDSIQTNKEGWMLDDIKLIAHTEGIADIGSRDEINIYPNPAAGRITVAAKTFTGEMDVSVYDILGQLRLQKRLDKIKEDIDISGLSKGIYTIRVLGRNNYWVRKIVKE